MSHPNHPALQPGTNLVPGAAAGEEEKGEEEQVEYLE